MCYHNSEKAKAAQLEIRYDATFEEGASFEPIYHASGYAYPQWPILTTEEPNAIKLRSWGLIPFWTKTRVQADILRKATLNAVSERVFETPSYRSVIGKKRCLIPSTGFFEWEHFKKEKYPYWIGVKENEIFSMAGVYDTWADPESGEVFDTYSILTIEANSIMAKIHNNKKRMPVILKKEDEMKWIDSTLKRAQIQELMYQYPTENIRYHTISKLITSRKDNANVPAVTDRFEYKELEDQV